MAMLENRLLGITLVGLAAVVFRVPCSVASSSEPAPSPQVTSGFVELADGKLYYERAGEGKNLVLIHDGLLPSGVWDEQFARYSRHLRVVRYDRRGYGRSSKPEAPYSKVDDLLALFDGLEIDRATVCGMSAGGGLAIDFTLAHPERVTGLVLVGAVVGGFPYTQHFLTRGGRMGPEVRADNDSLVRYFVEEDPWEMAPGNEAARVTARRLLAEYPPWEDRLQKRPQSPALPRLGEIEVGALVVVGEDDIPDVHAHAGAIAAGIPGARRVVIVGSGHLVPLEQPVAFDGAALAFIMGLDPLSVTDADSAAAFATLARGLRASEPDLVLVSEAAINAAGYSQLQAGRTEAAVALFELNVETFPDSWNVWDSLGEGYAALGNTEAAIRNYERSLELNPENSNGFEQLQRLRGSD